MGLNLDFVALNVLGHSVYALFNMGLYWLPSVQQQYFELYPMGVIPVQTNDVVFSVHATVLSLVTGVQCLVYERGSQRVWPGSWALIGLSTALVLCSCAAAAASALTWLSVLYYCSYVKLAVTLVKYVPQAYMNYARQSTVGFSIGGVLLDRPGGLLSILQMLLLAFNNGPSHRQTYITYLPTYITYLPTYLYNLPTYLPTYLYNLPTYLYNLLTYLPTYLPNYL